MNIALPTPEVPRKRERERNKKIKIFDQTNTTSDTEKHFIFVLFINSTVCMAVLKLFLLNQIYFFKIKKNVPPSYFKSCILWYLSVQDR